MVSSVILIEFVRNRSDYVRRAQLNHHKTPVIAAAASRYSNSFEGALVASTNAGGENVARGAVLGALLGADVGVRLASPILCLPACLLACLRHGHV